MDDLARRLVWRPVRDPETERVREQRLALLLATALERHLTSDRPVDSGADVSVHPDVAEDESPW
jgi:hypothetical protein